MSAESPSDLTSDIEEITDNFQVGSQEAAGIVDLADEATEGVTQSPPAGPTLLTIPLEIRLQIFDELMRGELIEVTHRTIQTPISWRRTQTSTVPYYWVHDEENSNPFEMCALKNQSGAARATATRFSRLGHNIVMTCSQLHAEAFLLPWKLSTFHFSHAKDFDLFCKHTTKERRGAVRSIHICIKHIERSDNIRRWHLALKWFRTLDYGCLKHLSIHLHEPKQVDWVNCAAQNLVRKPPHKRDTSSLFIPLLRTITVRADYPTGRTAGQDQYNAITAKVFEEIVEKVLLKEALNNNMANSLVNMTRAFSDMLALDPRPFSWSNTRSL